MTQADRICTTTRLSSLIPDPVERAERDYGQRSPFSTTWTAGQPAVKGEKVEVL